MSNSKKDFENSYQDSGFHSGFQDSSEISSQLAPADKVEGNSRDNELDSGCINSGQISDSLDIINKYMQVDSDPKFRRPPPIEKVLKYFEQNDDGNTTLHLAVLQNHIKAINALTQLVPDTSYLNIRNIYGQTALHLAVLEEHHETVHKLILAGADVNIRDNRCNTPLNLAISNASSRCAETILSFITPQGKILANLELWNFEGETSFFVACKDRNISLMRRLVAEGADVNAREGRSGYTPLHMAVESGAAEVVKFLCENCTSLNMDTENYAGLTSFQLSLLTGQESLANYLVSKGAFPYLIDENSDIEVSDCDSDYSNDEMEKNQIISKIAGIAVN